MPRIIDYELVLEQMTGDGMRCLYYNSGAFGFPADETVHTRGWIGPPDDSIREAAKPLVRHVTPPFEPTLAKLATRAWLEHLSGDLWVMPMSHWAFELDFGSADWMPKALRAIDLDPEELRPLTTGAALAFDVEESTLFAAFLGQLLKRLTASDFALAFPGKPARSTVHHHKQLWWQSTDANVIASLDTLLST